MRFKSRYFSYIMLGLVLFLFVYSIPFSFLPVNTAKFVVLILTSAFFIRSFSFQENSTITFDIFRVFQFIFVFVLLAVSWTFLSVGIYNQSDQLYIAYIYFQLLIENALGAFLIVYFWRKLIRSEKELFSLLILIAVIQSMIALWMFVDSDIMNGVFGILSDGEERLSLNQRTLGLRGMGLANTAMYDYAIVLSLSLIFSVYLVLNTKNHRLLLLLAVAFIIIIPGMLLGGRTGLIGLVFSLFLLFLAAFIFPSVRKSALLFLIFIIIAVAGGFSLFLLVSDEDTVAQVFETFLPWAFEIFVNIYQYGSVSTESTDELVGMYFWVPLDTFIVGDGLTIGSDGENYMHTDAGYMGQVLYYGVIGSLILYFMWIGLFFILYRKWNNTIAHFVVALLALYFFIAQIKGTMLLNSSMSIKVFFLLLMTVLFAKKSKFNLNNRCSSKLKSKVVIRETKG